MQIKTVHYSATINLGDYSNEKLGFTAQVAENESVEQVFEALKAHVRDLGGYNADQLYQAQSKGRAELAELERKICKARAEWDATAEFLRAQGIKLDAPVMPRFANLLSEVKEERFETVAGEIEESVF